MKHRFFTVLCFCAFYGYGLRAQKVTLQFKRAKLETVFEAIEKQTGYAIAYSQPMVNPRQLVDVEAHEEDLSAVLRRMFVGMNVEIKSREKKVLLRGDGRRELRVQKKNVKGTVVDEKGQPVVGATVGVKGTAQGVLTDLDGNYVLNGLSGDARLVVSCMGFESRELFVDDPSLEKIVLLENQKALDEVVVIGYGTVRKSDLTGAVASIKMDELNVSAPNLDNALVGHTPGVEIKQTSGAPGTAGSIRIRGVNSVYGGVEPLYVVDGFPASKDTYINTADIASIEILKDAASAAIYGSRASGGVILITTKRGSEGKPKVNFSYQFSMQNVLRKIDMMNSEQLLELHKDGYNNSYFDYLRVNDLYGSDEERWIHSRNDDNETRTAMGASNTMLLCPDFFNTEIDTDWQDEIFSSAPTNRADFSVSGGKERYKYMFSMGYLSQEGIISPSRHNRFTSRLNVDFDVTERFKLKVNSNMFYVKDRTVRSDGLAFADGIILNVLGMPTMYPVYNDDGTYATGLAYKNSAVSYNCFGGENPVALANEIQQYYTRFRSSLDVGMNYKFMEGLLLNVKAGLQISDQIYRYYRPAENLGQSNYDIGDFENMARASNDRDFNTDMLSEFTLNYDRTFGGKHMLSAVGGRLLATKRL